MTQNDAAVTAAEELRQSMALLQQAKVAQEATEQRYLEILALARLREIDPDFFRRFREIGDMLPAICQQLDVIEGRQGATEWLAEQLLQRSGPPPKPKRERKTLGEKIRGGLYDFFVDALLIRVGMVGFVPIVKTFIIFTILGIVITVLGWHYIDRLALLH
jgi:hypothetical protein